MTARGEPGASSPGAGTARPELRAAVGLCLAGALLALVAAGRSWATVAVPATDLLPARALVVSGSDLAPGITALALVGLAGVVALAATRSWGRIAVGVLIGLDGAGVLAVTADRLAGLGEAVQTSTAVREAGVLEQAAVDGTAWPYVALVGGTLLLAVGVLVAVRGPRWAALGRRYEAPAARPPLPEDPSRVATATSTQHVPPTERSLWEALDRGEDPTAR